MARKRPRTASSSQDASTRTTQTPIPPPAAMNPPPPPPPAAAAIPLVRGVRAIRGPQSALTDFLASHNISANQIRQDANARRAAALASQQAAAGGDDNEDDDDDEPISDLDVPARRKNESKAQSEKRKKEEEKAISKIKASKQFQRRRRQYGSDDTDEDEAARAIFEESHAPLPGQMENCEICDKRFTVTAYSRAGPDGGLLCPKCTKELDKEEGAAKKKRKTNAGRARRQMQSNLLDGIYPGAKDLMTLCIETLAKNVDQASDFGDLPPSLVDRLSAILCRKRLLSPAIFNLFLRPDYESVTVYDGAKLSSDEYIRIFQIMPKVKNIRLRNAVQFKNKVMDHLLGTVVELESLSLHGANLIDDERWNKYFEEKGSHLKALKVYYTDGHFGDDQIKALTKFCPQLERLKISHNQKVTDEGLSHIAKLTNLKHLSIELYPGNNASAPYVEILNSVGPALCTLSFATVHYVDDSVLEAIHENCQSITKLRLTDNEVMTDKGFADLFTNWYNPPLTYLDLHKCRHIDAAVPRENPDGIGLGSLGFEALMAHSGSTLRHLNVNSCRHISLETFEKVFAEDKKYPELKEMNLSFCQQVNDFVVGCIFRACPNLKTLKVFGNFGVRDVKVPKGRILIGVPNALGMQIEGVHDEDEGRVV